jgi:hypothetical protein
MTQPEQEAREVLELGRFADYATRDLAAQCRMQARENLDPEYSQFMAAVADRLSRPTAGIDREAVAKIIREHHAVEYGEDGTWSGTARHIGDYKAADAILALLPAAAKTGERGAVIEECAAIFEDAISKSYPTPANKRDQCAHGKYGWEECITCYDEALTEAVAKVRALSQPLPDAPIVSGEGS